MTKFYEDKTINEIANEVVKYMPSLGDYYASVETLAQYSKRINDYKPDPVHLHRQTHFKKKLQEKVQRLFTSDERQNIDLRIDERWGVVGGIVEHHGILDHPLLMSVSLVSNFYKLTDRRTNGDALVFATGNVPLNEPFRRRGFMLNGRKFNLYPKSYKNKVVYGLGTYDFDLKQRIVDAHEWHLLNKDEQTLLEKMNAVIRGIDFSTCNTIGDQLTKINFHLWPHLFEEGLRSRSANLVSIEYDDIVIDYLIETITHNTNNHVYQMLFDKTFREYIVREFEGKQGAWDDEKEVGTHFFWALDSDNERIRLTLEGNYLVGKDKRIELEPETIISELKSKTILPGMLLKFSLIVFYMGMKPLMGYSLEYMVRLREKMIDVLSKHFPEEAERCKNIPYDNMNLISICKGRDKDGHLKDIHAFDVFFRGGFTADYLGKLDSLPFKNFMVPALLFAYNYAAGKYGRPEDKKLFAVSEQQLQSELDRLL